MKLLRYILVLIVGFMLVACVGPKDYSSLKISTITDDVTQKTKYVGPDLLPGPYWTLRMQASEGMDALNYEVYSEANYYTGRNRLYLNDMEGDSYIGIHSGHRVIDIKENECRGRKGHYSEVKVVPLSAAELDQYKDTGYSFTFTCKWGSTTLDIPGQYIQTFMDTVSSK